MATTSTEKKAAVRKTAARTAAKAPVQPSAAADAPAAPDEATKAPGKTGTVIKPRKLDPEMYVVVRNGYPGLLVYKSTKTGERFRFEGFGDEHEIELQELKKAKNEFKDFFINNWFLIDDPEVIEYLGVGQYYKDAFTYEEFEELADMTAEEVAARIRQISDGQKLAVTRYAQQLIRDGRIDSVRVIRALEDGLGVKLAAG